MPSSKIKIVLLWGIGLALWFAFDLFAESVIFEFLQWNGTTKNDWFFVLWWLFSGFWSIYCLRLILRPSKS